MTKVTLATEKDICKICIFIKEKYEACRHWKEGKLYPWVEWFCKSKFCVIAKSRNGKIISLLMGRPVSDLEDKDFYHYDFRGLIFFVDIIINPCSLVLAMKDMMEKSVGVKHYLAFTRDRGKINKVHVYPLEKILRYYEPRTK